MTHHELIALVRRLLPSSWEGSVGISSVPRGANNRVFRVQAGDQSYMLKQYFNHPGDARDRLAVEFSFSSFAWQNGLRCLPRPIACDARRRLALYEFVEGSPVAPGEVGLAEIHGAANFLAALNRVRNGPDASHLANGSEACFSFAEHTTCLERRIERLLMLEPSSPVDREARDFVADALAPAARSVKAQIFRQLGRTSFERVLAPLERCLSPSDFGFHNALRRPGGELCFVDFEYAGWDDPARMVADFFCQVAVPVPRRYLDVMIRAVAAAIPGPGSLDARVALLLPVYHLKWSCILLNEFLREGRGRREFAGGLAGLDARKKEQLRKARMMLDSMREAAVA